MLTPCRFSKSGAACVDIKIIGGDGTPHRLEAIVDTGFSGFVHIPESMGMQMGLVRLPFTSTETLADGSKRQVGVAAADVQFQRRTRAGYISLAPDASMILIGMGFLRIFQMSFIVVPPAMALLYDSTRLRAVLQQHPGTAPMKP